MEEVPRRTSLVPLASLVCTLFNIRVEQNRRVFRTTRGGRGIMSTVQWNLRPVIFRARPKRGVQQRTLLTRVLRRVLETAFEKVLRRVLRRCLAVGFNGKKV